MPRRGNRGSCVAGRRGLIKLDIDAEDRPSIYDLVRRCARAGYRIRYLCERRSPGGCGWHLTLAVRPHPKTPEEVVALQAILGSDLEREAANLFRAARYRDAPAVMKDRWNVLYY